MRRIVSLLQLAAQQGVDPDIGAPAVIRVAWPRPGTGRRPEPAGLPGGQLQRLFAGPGLHHVVIELPCVGVLSDYDAKQWHRRYFIRALAPGGKCAVRRGGMY